jgi:hypothetical protein
MEAAIAVYLVVAFLFWGLLHVIALFNPTHLKMWTLLVLAVIWPYTVWWMVRYIRRFQ